MKVPNTRKLFQLTLCLFVVGGLLSAYYLVHNGIYQYTPQLGTYTESQMEQNVRDILAHRLPLFQARQSRALPFINGSTYDPEHDVIDTSFFKKDQHSLDSTAVILFSYMRSGSSFVGDALFNNDPDVFYAFEPLAPLYVAMYGLEVSSVIDTDLIFWANGTVRKFPPEEVQAITWMLSNLLTCNVTSFPLEMYGHHFWDWSHGLYKYSDCIQTHSVLDNLKSCHDYVQPVCGSHFAEYGVDTALCFENMWQPFWRNVSHSKENTPTSPLDDYDANKFKLYRECLGVLKEAITQCQPLLQEQCRESTIRATKIVRGSMGTLDKLMELMPNLHIIHLFRDPRGVVRSRRSIDWSQGHYDGSDVTKLAQTYCKRVSMDTHQRKLMQKKYSNRIMELLYDDMVEDPFNDLRAVYEFLGIDMTPGAANFIQYSMQESQGLKAKWSYELGDEDIANIQRSCQEFTTETGFDWERFNVPIGLEPRVL